MRLVTLMLAFTLLLAITMANGVGNTVEKSVDGISFEFGIDPEKPRVNEPVTMSLSVHNASTGSPINVDNLWIRISKDNEVFFASSDFGIKEQGPIFMSYIFKESGEHVVDFSAKLHKDIKTNFVVDVKRSKKPAIFNLIAILVVFFIGYSIRGLGRIR